jgi:hypothetical protein
MKTRRRAYRVVRVTTVIEVCYVGMPTRKLAEQWAKPSDAVECTEYTTGWKADLKPLKDSV